ncbi:MAG TPA: hypothetical protein DCE41_19580, partial [Cytophagales bacterium]|nr:hypothetical protein [Cytophagales bacterium]
MRLRVLTFLCFFGFLSGTSFSTSYHVSIMGDDANPGTNEQPFLTIGRASEVAQPGDSIIIHAGTYREYVDPPRGGSSPRDRIIYMAAENEEVFVKGSEAIDTWVDQGDGSWRVALPLSFFGEYNPYTLFVDGDFQGYGQWHHRGDVYLENAVLHELRSLSQLLVENYTWYTESTEDSTVIWANFGNENPNEALTEINVRELIFFASQINVDYITVDGLRFLHAAPNWQAPNIGASDPNPLTQVGALGCNMGLGWIIQNCEVSYSKTAGIMLGESFDDEENFQNITAFGDHLVQNNVITRCGEYGIAGQKGLSRSAILNNRIEDINYRREFGGFETAGIKIWNCADVHIEGNLIRRVHTNLSTTSSAYGIWIDFANQGTRITRNVVESSLYTQSTLFLEANVGPTLVDNNVFLERTDRVVLIYSGGSILAHNLFIDANFDFDIQRFDNAGSGARRAYTLRPHSLVVTNPNTPVNLVYNQVYNNIFAGGNGPDGFGNNSGTGNLVDFNLYMNGAVASGNHSRVIQSSFAFSHALTETTQGLTISFEMDDSFVGLPSPTVDTALVGIIPLAEQSIADEAGHPITVDSDFEGVSRPIHPTLGPLQNMVAGTNTLQLAYEVFPTPGVQHPVPEVESPTVEQGPFLDDPAEIPGTVEAENYDVGGQGVSFNDDEVKNGDGGIRPDDNVDLGNDGANGTVVGWFDNGDWMEYTVNVAAGTYRIVAEAASAL